MARGLGAALGLLSLLGAAAARRAVLVSGVDGPEANINGVYRPTTKVVNGGIAYKQDDHDNWLVRDPKNGLWNIQPGGDRGTTNGYMVGLDLGLATPENGSRWRVWRGDAWVLAPLVKVTPLNEEKTGWMWAVAALLLAIVLLLAGLCLAFCAVRSYLYDTLAYMLAAMVGILISQATILCLRGGADTDFGVATAVVFPTLFGRSIAFDGVWYLVFLAVVALLCFLGMYMSKSPLGWKFQFSHIRLLALAMLQATLTGFLGFYAFSAIGNLFPLGETWKSIIVLIVAGLILGAFPMATHKLRERSLLHPPAEAWPLEPEGADRLEHHVLYSEYVVYAEAEAGSIIMAFLLFALAFGWTGVATGWVRVIQVVVFALILAVLVAGGSNLGRAGFSFVHHWMMGTAARFVGLSFLGSCAWFLMRFLRGEYFFVILTLALLLTALVLGGLLLFGLLGGKSDAPGWVRAGALPGQAQALASKACAGLGLMIAVPWAELMTEGIGAVVGSSAFWEGDGQVWLKVALSLAVAVGLCFCWRFFVAHEVHD